MNAGLLYVPHSFHKFAKTYVTKHVIIDGDYKFGGRI